MGNRAQVIFTDNHGHIGPAVYLHWNGGPESVYRFLDELDRRKVRSDVDYCTARFIHIVGDYFDFDFYGESDDASDFSGINPLSLGVENGPDEITPEALAKVLHFDLNNGAYVVKRDDKGGREVRRFKARAERSRPNVLLVEEIGLSAVEAEREQAYKATGEYEKIPEVFLKIRPKISDIR